MTGVYAIGSEEEGPVKIGISNDPKARLATLQTANPNELSILGWWPCENVDARKIEGDVLRILEPARLRGEWFETSLTEIRRAVKGAIKDAGQDDRAECYGDTLEKLQGDLLSIAGIVGDKTLSYDERLLRIFKIVSS